MNNLIQIKIIAIISVLFFTFTLSPISLVSTIFNIHIIMYSSSIKSVSTESTLPCSYISSKMEKPSSFLKNLVKKPVNNKVDIDSTTPIKSTAAAKYTPITIPAKLTQAQKEAALPFLTQEPLNKSRKSTSSKSKTLGRFFKKLAKATSARNCLKSTSTQDKKKTQYKLTFIPIIRKKENIEQSTAEATEFVWYDSDMSSTISTESEDAPAMDDTQHETTATEYAQRIWDEDQTVYNNLDHIVEWIGNGKPTSNAILESYMSHFDFEDLTLEQAFRNLCSKLHFKGETQQIDRILLQFSARYHECNPQSIFGTADVVHAIVYSLLLLNTDLHVAQGDYKKMTQTAFVKNTMYAISGESLRGNILSSVQPFDSVPLQRTPTNRSDYSTYAQSFDSTTLPHQSSSSYTLGSKAWQSEIRNLLKQMYNSIRQSQLTNPSSPPTSLRQTNNRVSNAFRRSLGTINWKETTDKATTTGDAQEDTASVTSNQSSTPSSIEHYQSVASQLENFALPSYYTCNAPYYKEGMVARKHLLEKSNQKAKYRDWKECFMVIERSQLRMYKLKDVNKRSLSSYAFSDTASQVSNNSIIGGGNWMSSAQLIGAFDLKHTLSNILPSGYSHRRQHAFTIQQPNGAVYVFQVGSNEQAQEWISTCNYWAARESKEPLVGGISSMEYGWGSCLNTTCENVFVHEWQTPACPTISSMLDESFQLEVLRKHVKELSVQLDQHRDIKTEMVSHFSGSRFYSRAMINWENKSRYLLHEIIKYQNYCNSIERSLALQASLKASSI